MPITYALMCLSALGILIAVVVFWVGYGFGTQRNIGMAEIIRDWIFGLSLVLSTVAAFVAYLQKSAFLELSQLRLHDFLPAGIIFVGGMVVSAAFHLGAKKLREDCKLQQTVNEPHDQLHVDLSLYKSPNGKPWVHH